MHAARAYTDTLRAHTHVHAQNTELRRRLDELTIEVTRLAAADDEAQQQAEEASMWREQVLWNCCDPVCSFARSPVYSFA